MQEAERQHLKQQFSIIGNSPPLNRAIEVAAQVAPTAMTVLITGESGTGKESFSKLIHSLSPYKHGKFIAINCGAIPEGTIDSELFGHERGAFTGAAEARRGYFEEVDKGTIFLDEIGEMPLGTQTRLLRILEYGEFIKVGSSKTQKVKVRVIAATNVDLLEAVNKSKFREDLYYRLSTVPIYIPPLRERGADITLLFRKFATEFADQYYVKPIHLTQDAQEMLLRYRFPGNIRQLKNLVEQISVLEIDRTITQEKLAQYLPQAQPTLPALYQPAHVKEGLHEREILYRILFDMRRDMNELKGLVRDFLDTRNVDNEVIKALPKHLPGIAAAVTTLPNATQGTDPDLADQQQHPKPSAALQAVDEENLSIEVKEKELIGKALARHSHNRRKAAENLGISERTLYRKITQYGLEQTS
ncbi:MAG: sigma-54 dependent transcriptional regulator [Bacteroidota bacterium]